MLKPTKLLIPAQVAAAVIGLFGLTIWPPVSGNILLVPLTINDSNAVAKAALASGALLVGRGPFRGSLVVFGNRSSIARQSGSWNILVLAAPPAGCGGGATTLSLT